MHERVVLLLLFLPLILILCIGFDGRVFYDVVFISTYLSDVSRSGMISLTQHSTAEVTVLRV